MVIRRWWYLFTDLNLERECLGCLDSLGEMVGNHRRKQRKVDVDDGAVVWLCANERCGSCKLGIIYMYNPLTFSRVMCTLCAVHWANRELSRFRPPTCPRCDGYWEIKTLVDHARTCNPKGPDRPIRPPPINRFVDKHGRSDDLMSGMIRFRNIYRKPDGSEYDSAEAYMFWLVVMINDSAGFTYHGSDSEKHLFERVWESSYQVYSVDDTDNRLPAESTGEESGSARSSFGRSEGGNQSLSPPTSPGHISGNYETEASRYASEAMNSANIRLRFAQPAGNQQLFVRSMRSEPVMRQRAPLRGLSHQPNFRISRDISGHRTVSVNSFSTMMNATPTDVTPTEATVAKASMRTCNTGYFACGKSKTEKPVVGPFLDMLEGTLRRVAKEKSSEALCYQRFSGAVEQAGHERVIVASEFGQAKSPRDPVRLKRSILRRMASVPVLAMNKLGAGRYLTTEPCFLPAVDRATKVDASDPLPVSRTLDFDSTIRRDTVDNVRDNTPCQQSGNLRKPSPTGNWRCSLSSSKDFIKVLSTLIIPQDADSSRGALPRATLASSIHTDSDSISKSEKSDASNLKSNASNHALFGGADSTSNLLSGWGSERSRISHGKMESMANSVDSNRVHSHTHAHLPGVDARSTLTSLDTASSSTGTSRVSYEPCLSRPDEHSAYLHIRVPARLPPPLGTIPYSRFSPSDDSKNRKGGSGGNKLELKGLWRKFIKKK